MPQIPASLRWIAILAFFGGLILSMGSASGQFVPGEVNNIFPLAPRELRQRLSRAQAALDEERFSDAVAETSCNTARTPRRPSNRRSAWAI